MTRARSPRRLTQAARREQLADAALEIVARDGLTGFSLDDVADHADVSRNLLYHYFPRGRQDVMLAAVQRAGERLMAGWIVEGDERLTANLAGLREHTRAPSAAWRIYREARTSADPEVREAVDSYVRTAVANVAFNNLGTTDPPPLARVAINGFLAFGELVIDEARREGVPDEEVDELLATALRTVVEAVRS
jgi:AcrR family transcriptional regulator